MTLDKTSETIEVDDVIEITPTVTPANATNKNWTVASDATSIVTVQKKNGKVEVKGISEGSGTITVTTEDGGYTATCSVTVVSKLETGEWTTPYLPTDTFILKEGSLSEGIVIQDKKENEYVWVEVPTSIYDNNTYNSNGTKKPSNSEDSENIEYCLQTYAADYRDSNYTDEYYADSSTGWYADETEYNNDKNAMLKSVYENGGFWIGRYEVGLTTKRIANTETEKTTPSTLPEPIIKQNAYPYNNVTRTQAKVLANRLINSEHKCSLIYGIQWDLTLRYLQSKGTDPADLKTNSTSWGNYQNNRYTSVTYPNGITNLDAMYSTDEGTSWTQITETGYKKNADALIVLTTGAHPEFKKQNIYDLAGNVHEWTLEKYKSNDSKPCTYRGGAYGNSGYTYCSCKRTFFETNLYYKDIGIRFTIF